MEINNKRGSRYKARKRAVEILFESLIKEENFINIMESRKILYKSEINFPNIPEYTQEILVGIKNNLEKIDDEIKNYLVGWEFNRISNVDKAILRLAFWEILFNDKVPNCVAIDEALELAKSLSSDKSSNFINGILGNLVSK